MKSVFEQRTAMAGFAITVPFTALVWLFAVPHALSAVSFVAVTLVAVGAAVVAVIAWRNGQPTRQIGHVLNDAEAAAASPLVVDAQDASKA